MFQGSLPDQPWRLIKLVWSNSADVHWDVHQGTVPLELGKGSFDHVPETSLVNFD